MASLYQAAIEVTECVLPPEVDQVQTSPEQLLILDGRTATPNARTATPNGGGGKRV